jgi:allophanate hydrolase subunit 2
VVISADMDLIAQLQPHTPARFVPVTLEEALVARAEGNAALVRAEEYLAG